MLTPDQHLEIEDAEDDGATILDDGLSTYDEERNNDHVLFSQAAAKRAAAKQYKFFTLSILCFSFFVSVIVASIAFYRNPNTMSQEGGLFGSSSKSTDEKNALRLKQTLEYLIKYDVSDPATLDVASNFLSGGNGGVLYTPQYRAALWIAKHDKYRIPIPSSTSSGPSNSMEDYPFLQRYALATFFFSTGGLDWWKWKINFLMGWHECAWFDNFQVQGIEGDVPFGVLCDGKPDYEEGEKDSWSGRRTVTGIFLPPKNNMLGTLPPELHLLKYMKVIYIQHEKYLMGSIPFQYGWFKKMEAMVMPHNNLSGKIPRAFDFMTKLSMLSLEGNNLSADTTAGDLNFLQDMPSLELLSLGFNSKIEGTVPEFLSELTNLESLLMDYTGLYGTLPSSISNLAKLRVLAFSNTQIDGSLPSSFSQLTSLRALYLDDCNLEGNINVIHDMPSLTRIYLENNYFNDTLDNTSFVNLENLVHLDISNCSFSGSVPGHLFNFSQLRVLDMHKNQLTGEMPAEAMESIPSSKLDFLSLHSNKITGPIPASIGKLGNLTTLDLSDNLFTGDMPVEIGKLSELSVLFLGKNNFTVAPVPAWIRNLTKLTELSLKDSSLNETIPSWLGELGSLTFLDLGENGLTETIPQSLGNLTRLMVLILNSNQLTGELGLGELRYLEAILIDDNDLTGNTDAMCAHTIEHFISDCGGSSTNTSRAELECECCTLCCSDENATCNDSEWTGNHEGMWEFGYDRLGWDFEEGYISPLIPYNYCQMGLC